MIAFLKMERPKPGVVVHALHASTQTEAGKFKASLVYIMNLRQSELHSKTLSQNKAKRNKMQATNK